MQDKICTILSCTLWRNQNGPIAPWPSSVELGSQISSSWIHFLNQSERKSFFFIFLSTIKSRFYHIFNLISWHSHAVSGFSRTFSHCIWTFHGILTLYPDIPGHSHTESGHSMAFSHCLRIFQSILTLYLDITLHFHTVSGYSRAFSHCI